LTWIFAVGSDSVNLKKQAAEKALEFVAPGMRLGLGSGSTSACFVDCVGEAVKNGLTIIGVPTSEATRRQAEALGVDGADEFDPGLNLIKGGGGALLREKIVAASSKRMVVIADASKRVARLGAFPLPIEVAPFGLESTKIRLHKVLASLGLSGKVELRRRAGEIFVTDGGHYILDCALGAIPDPRGLAVALEALPGVMDHGLFIGLASLVVIAGASGVEVIGSKT
jgi:ribose 5-phosphate isomerase A